MYGYETPRRRGKLIQNKGHHEHEYHTRCECEECICGSYPYEKLCYFCKNGQHNGHKHELELRENESIVLCVMCTKMWRTVEGEGK